MVVCVVIIFTSSRNIHVVDFRDEVERFKVLSELVLVEIGVGQTNIDHIDGLCGVA